MASYIENFNSKLDLALPFQRTGEFPLDRTDVFSSYADAVKYAAGNKEDPDSRGLCSTSYIGQVIAVYENDTVTIYKINANRTLSTIGSGSGSVTPDGKSIIINTSDELAINGYADATVGQMPVKNDTAGLTWVTPVSSEQLDAAVAVATEKAAQASNSATQASTYASQAGIYSEQSATSANTAGTYATTAGNHAISAATSASTAQRINEQTMAWVNEKFWWGTESEYNALEEINEGTFYFVQLA